MYIGQHYNVAPFGSNAFNVYLKNVGSNFVGSLSHGEVSRNLGTPRFTLKHVHDVALKKFGKPDYGNSANLFNQLEHTGHNVLGRLQHTKVNRGII